jgi:tetratricopeptide (TPR) repeat protein
MAVPRVFVSYSHDSDAHAARVLALTNHLRETGFDAEIDQFIIQPSEGWTDWMEHRIRESDFTLLVCTERYLRRVNGEEPPGPGRGVRWEGKLIKNALYRDRAHNTRFIPVYFEVDDGQFIPEILRDWNAYHVGKEAGWRHLVDHLAGRAAAKRTPLGPRPAAWTRQPPDVDRHDLGGRLHPGTAPLPRTATPAHLLTVRHAVVPFTGREPELAWLGAWADADAPFGVHLVHGAGGQGKTRLALQWAAQRREAGWDAGFVQGELTAAHADALVDAPRDVVAVIDFAETRPGLGGFLDRLAAAREQGARRGRLRVLLLARNAGDWWAALRERSPAVGDLLDDAPPPYLLRPLHEEVPDRLAELHRAVAAFAPRLQRPVPSRLPDLSDDRYGRVLYIHMAAVNALLGDGSGAADVRRDVLVHEARFWVRCAGLESAPTPQQTELKTAIRRALTALTLRGGAPHADDLHLLLTRLEIPDASRVESTLDRLYPARDPARFVAPLEPDILGEALVHETLMDKHTPHAFLARTLSDATAEERTTAFLVLGRIETEYPAEAREWLRHALDLNRAAQFEPAFEAALLLGAHTAYSDLGRLLAAALETPHDPAWATEAAARIVDRIPDQTVFLRELGVVATRLCLEATPPGADHDAERARLANSLGNRYTAIGRPEEALAAAEEAVSIHRALAKARPDAFLPDLATSLNSLGGKYDALRRYKEALKAAKKAVSIHRTLAKARPDAFLPGLARSLNNLGNRYDALRRYEEALAAAKKAVSIHRTLAKARPDAFLPTLAGSLNNLGDSYLAVRRYEEALAATEEAVSTYRALAKARPDAFLPDLTASLDTLGKCNAARGDPPAALSAYHEAVERLGPSFVRLPAAHARLMRDLIDDYRRACAEAGTAPDEALLGPLERLLEGGA